MADDKLIAKIEDWLDGKLPPGEAAEFGAQVAADPALAEEVELHRLTLLAMRQLSENDLQDKVLGWLDEVPITRPPGPPPQPRKIWPWLVFAALLLLMAGVFGVKKWASAREEAHQQELDTLKEELKVMQQRVFQQESLRDAEPAKLDSLRMEYDELLKKANALERQLESKPNKANPNNTIASVEDFYSLPTWTGGVRSERNTGTTLLLLQESMSAFNNFDFRKASETSQLVLKAEPENKAALRLFAHSLFNQKRYAEAIPAFAKLREVAIYEEEADWNTMLCYWMLAKVDAGQKLLFEQSIRELAKSPNPKFAVKAKELMRLEKIK